MVTLVNKLQQICTGLGEGAFSGQNILWNKLPMIVVVGGQASGRLEPGFRRARQHILGL